MCVLTIYGYWPLVSTTTIYCIVVRIVFISSNDSFKLTYLEHVFQTNKKIIWNPFLEPKSINFSCVYLMDTLSVLSKVQFWNFAWKMLFFFQKKHALNFKNDDNFILDNFIIKLPDTGVMVKSCSNRLFVPWYIKGRKKFINKETLYKMHYIIR